MNELLFTLILLCALGSGLIAGVFYAFSTFVMKALAQRPAAEGMAAMQSINVVVLNPWFLGVFMGTAALGAVAAVFALVRWSHPASAWLLAGGLLYVVGTFGVTIWFNVPLNNTLAKLDPTDPAAAGEWVRYVRLWTRWNHVRTAAALAALACFAIAL